MQQQLSTTAASAAAATVAVATTSSLLPLYGVDPGLLAATGAAAPSAAAAGLLLGGGSGGSSRGGAAGGSGRRARPSSSPMPPLGTEHSGGMVSEALGSKDEVSMRTAAMLLCLVPVSCHCLVSCAHKLPSMCLECMLASILRIKRSAIGTGLTQRRMPRYMLVCDRVQGDRVVVNGSWVGGGKVERGARVHGSVFTCRGLTACFRVCFCCCCCCRSMRRCCSTWATGTRCTRTSCCWRSAAPHLAQQPWRAGAAAGRQHG
jgi:hypothetical protein